MILAFVAKGKRMIARCFLAVIYLEVLIPANVNAATTPVLADKAGVNKVVIPAGVKLPAALPKLNSVASKAVAAEKVDFGGPTQPEMETFHAVGSDEMVDLFSGDFSYSIPLMDVGGYPVTLAYNSGISMDQDASWVGLGWNINPGSITRNLRGLPDDFNGKNDFVTKETTIKENRTVGITGGLDLEIAGIPKPVKSGALDSVNLDLSFSLGVFKNSYRGIGLETGFSAGLNAGNKSKGRMTGSLSFSNNSQTGFTISPSFSYSFAQEAAKEKEGYGQAVSLSTGYNSRSGLTSLQVSGYVRKYQADAKNRDGKFSRWGSISFANPAYSPTISIPYTNQMATVTLKTGALATVLHPNISLSGYISRQFIADKDKKISLPAFGYLNFEAANNNKGALLDFNRDKEVPYREVNPVSNIGIPSYTYDVFTMTGEGIGGNFRAYRNDIGYVYDHEMTTRDASGAISLDLGAGSIMQMGVDLFYTRAYTKSSLWEDSNPLKSILGFRNTDRKFEPAYFRSPGEKTVNATSFYDAMGGDNVVAVRLSQPGSKGNPFISSTNKLIPYASYRQQPDIELTTQNTVKPAREKRTQTISYLTAKEASEVGLSKYIEYYPENVFSLGRSKEDYKDEYYGEGDGLLANYYGGTDFNYLTGSTTEKQVAFFSKDSFKLAVTDKKEYFSMQMLGKLKVPVSGIYTFKTRADDGIRLFINGDSIINDFNKGSVRENTVDVPIEGGRLYDVRLDYKNHTAYAIMELSWKHPLLGQNFNTIPSQFFYKNKNNDYFKVKDEKFFREKRVTQLRKENHISEIDVLNPDGRRYVYGIPVYNISQKQATFSVEKKDANANTGLVKYTPGVDDSLSNKKGRDWYYNAEYMPAYAHSFLLTGILSPDYVDITGNGISDDDAGTAIRFGYTRTASIENPFRWRAPYSDSATYNEGFKTESRDDKGSYVSGTKELYYLNSIESKSMVAFFTLEGRNDLLQMDSLGRKSNGGARRLKKIDLYVKADYLKDPAKAKPVKTVYFSYTNELCMGVNNSSGDPNTSGKLTLKEVWFSYNGNEKGKKNAYRFRYNKFNPAYSSNKYDRWGNYKDPSKNPGGVSNADYPYALQDSTLMAQYAAAWTLDSIELPSGGRIKVDYESDDYAYVQNKKATQMLQVYGFSKDKPVNKSSFSPKLYDESGDFMYVGIKVPYAVKSDAEVAARYLQGLDKIYFRMSVKMPTDNFGGGNEYIPCYAEIDKSQGYGYVENGTIIWLKLSGVSPAGLPLGNISPLTKTALQFLKLNLPSKAYPGSDVGDDLDGKAAVTVLFTQVDNIGNLLVGFDANARRRRWVQDIDTSRSMVRLDNPYGKKYGGGLRVKRITNYDYWNKMTGQRGAIYGKEYSYTTTERIGTETLAISSGVASYEPLIGGEENPWRTAKEYTDRVSVMAPTTIGYMEEPLGESFFPAPSVGYSKVRVRTINAKNNRSANGYDETCFYTTRDFPTLVETTVINDNTKKRFKNELAKLLNIACLHYLAVSQGFKIELNDMNGKLRSQATYAESDPDNWLTYSENFYHVDNTRSSQMHLNNRVLTIDPKGVIQTSEIGKDMELMFDMRQERSVSIGANVGLNAILFTAPVTPFSLLTAIPLPQYEENIFRSVAATKVINRHGILDSVMVIDKGSKVVTHNLLYDTESGEPVLTSVQNEYNDKIYNFTYPAGWIYEGMSGAYKNIGTLLQGIGVKEGKIVKGLAKDSIASYFFSGDEILAYTKRKVDGTDCNPVIAKWPGAYKVYAVDANMLKGGKPDIYFVHQDGTPFTGNDVYMKTIRSGRRNIAASAGTIRMLNNPIVGNQLVLNAASGIIDASMTEYKEFWKVPDIRMPGIVIDTFRNDTVSRVFDVKCGATVQKVKVTIPAAKFSSVKSQTDADDIAKSYLNNYGMFLAAQQIKCGYYYNTADTLYFQKECGDRMAFGDSVKYIIRANTDSSLVSVEAANVAARAKAYAAGQALANSMGRCYYKSMPISGMFTKSCSPGQTAVPVRYSLPWGADTSYISQDAANQKAKNRLAVEGPAYASTNSYCTMYAKLVIENKIDYPREPRGYYTKGDLVIYFYEDEACTTPVATGNIPVKVTTFMDYSPPINQPESPIREQIGVTDYTANGPRKVLARVTTYDEIVWDNTSAGRDNTEIFRYYFDLQIDPSYNIIVK